MLRLRPSSERSRFAPLDFGPRSSTFPKGIKMQPSRTISAVPEIRAKSPDSRTALQRYPDLETRTLARTRLEHQLAAQHPHAPLDTHWPGSQQFQLTQRECAAEGKPSAIVLGAQFKFLAVLADGHRDARGAGMLEAVVQRLPHNLQHLQGDFCFGGIVELTARKRRRDTGVALELLHHAVERGAQADA